MRLDPPRDLIKTAPGPHSWCTYDALESIVGTPRAQSEYQIPPPPPPLQQMLDRWGNFRSPIGLLDKLARAFGT